MVGVSFAALLGLALAKTNEYDWTLSWIDANLDGEATRQVVSINGEHPLPVLNISMGDQIVAKVTNNLTNPARNTTFHWHGIFQNGTSGMDGPPMMNQCPQPPGTTVTYNFTVNQTGTYWYHAHVEDLYPDGQRQMLLVQDDEPPFDYDEEISFSMQDWYHELYEVIRDRDFMTLYNPTGAEPVPDNILINETADTLKVQVEVGKTYRLRVVSTSTFSAFYWFMENYNLTMVEADGVYTENATANLVQMGVGQRYSVLFTPTEDNTVYRFCMMSDVSLYDIVPDDMALNRTMFFYTGDEDSLTFEDMDNDSIYTALGWTIEDDVDADEYTVDDLTPLDDTTLVPSDGMPLLPDPDVNITLHLELTNLLDGVNYAFLNQISYTKPLVPSLYSAIYAPNDTLAEDATIYGTNTHTYVLDHMDVVQITLNNDDTGKHPFHLHGHNFQLLGRGDEQDDYTPFDPSEEHDWPEVPMRRDVFIINPQSWFVIRFRADNPGVWIFHCHIEWHLTQGLALMFVEAPLQIRQNEKIPQDFLDICTGNNLTYAANAAANSANWTDLEGEPLQVADLPAGFTARGIVALVFSTICAFVGMGFLVWYGLTDTTVAEQHQVAHAEHQYERDVDYVAEEQAHEHEK